MWHQNCMYKFAKILQLLGDLVPRPPTGALPLDPSGGWKSSRTLVVAPFCKILNTPLIITALHWILIAPIPTYLSSPVQVASLLSNCIAKWLYSIFYVLCLMCLFARKHVSVASFVANKVGEFTSSLPYYRRFQFGVLQLISCSYSILNGALSSCCSQDMTVAYFVWFCCLDVY
jgi:hypothetical protein